MTLEQHTPAYLTNWGAAYCGDSLGLLAAMSDFVASAIPAYIALMMVGAALGFLPIFDRRDCGEF